MFNKKNLKNNVVSTKQQQGTLHALLKDYGELKMKYEKVLTENEALHHIVKSMRDELDLNSSTETSSTVDNSELLLEMIPVAPPPVPPCDFETKPLKKSYTLPSNVSIKMLKEEILYKRTSESETPSKMKKNPQPNDDTVNPTDLANLAIKQRQNLKKIKYE
eukprot:gene5810-9633_t